MARFAPPLTPRQADIVLAVVREHVHSKAPVGSSVVREKYGVNSSTATIRNEMVVLERSGYLHQPHTSAGRVPLDVAYRLFVNHLKQQSLQPPYDDAAFKREYRRIGREAHQIIRHTTRLLARMTSHPALVMSPAPTEPTIASLKLQPVSTHSVLLTYTLADGERREHLLRIEEKVTAAQVAAVSEALQRLVTGKSVSHLSRLSSSDLQACMKEQPLQAGLLQALCAAAAADDTTAVYVEGASYILDEPEFVPRDRLRGFMRTLDEEASLRQVLNAADSSDEVTVTIGEEHTFSSMHHCSLVARSYRAGRSQGVVGILGPTRMDYEKTIATITMVAQVLEETLNENREEEQ